MKKRLFALLTALALALTLVPVSVLADETAVISCSDRTAAPDDWINVTISGQGLKDLAALELELYYDPQVLHYQYDSQGWLLNGSVYHVHDNGEGRIALSAVSSQGISGEGTLVELSFRVDAACPPGSYPLTLAVGEAYDSALSPAVITADSGSVTVTDAPASRGQFPLGMALSAETLTSGDTLTVTLQNSWGNGFCGLDLCFSYDPALFELVEATIPQNLLNESVSSLNTSTAGLVRLTCASPRNLWCYDLLTVQLRAREGASGATSLSAQVTDIYDESLLPYQPDSAQAEVTIEKHPQSVVPSLRLSCDPLAIGTESSAKLILDAGSGLAAADFRLEYDPDLLQCIAVESATDMGYLVINPNWEDGLIRFSYVNESGAEAETPLITIRWTPRANADRHYSIRTTLIDPVNRDHERLQIDCPEMTGCIWRTESTDATCTQPGGSARVCVGCGSRTPLDPTPALGHDYGAPEFRWAADYQTCTAVRICARDSSHIWQVDCEITAVTNGGSCSEPGSVVYTATADFDGTRFTDDVSVVLDAIGHDYIWTTVTEPGCLSQGLRQGECTRCGDILQEVLEPLGHDWDGASCRRCGEVRDNPFTDVPEGSFYYEPVIWAVANGITNGTSATTFGPGDSCMRAHVVTFLWRAAGSPEPSADRNPFTDVKPTDFYYKAVLWAVENGITNGISAVEFGPFAYCNRAQVVTFLHRALGSPKPAAAQNPFTDVPAGQWFTDPVLWAVEHGITNGLSATSFGPTTVCNRAQIVTFLYRAFA